IEKADPDSARLYFDQKPKPEKHELKYDKSVKNLLVLDEMNHRKTDVIGAKAANFGELAKVLNRKGSHAKVPESAFAIPFYYYVNHIKICGADTLIDKLIGTSSQDRIEQQKLLKEIRKRIKNSAVDPDLLIRIETMVVGLGEYRRMRFRSSTNAEDIDGFNGAGLYTSATGIVGDESSKTVEKALQKVWASVWNDRAFFERDYFGM